MIFQYGALPRNGFPKAGIPDRGIPGEFFTLARSTGSGGGSGGGGFFTDTRDYPRAEETRDDVMKKLMKEDREMFDLIQIIVATGVMD
ncbi:hypothetical protein LCGC14_2018520 [marine sediment metagenome]|uniref:Uncharacterized protein n=1 Tax=marine sediment metagenome TaxID=412755 RepID=A0A0F9HBJ8_9ZZZZ